MHNASLILGEVAALPKPSSRFTGELVWSVESLVPKRLTLPIHRMTFEVEFADLGYSARVQWHFGDTRHLAHTDVVPDVRWIGNYIVIDGPGMVETYIRSDEEPPPLPSTQWSHLPL